MSACVSRMSSLSSPSFCFIPFMLTCSIIGWGQGSWWCVINPVWIWGMWDMCLCLGGVGGECTWGLEKGICGDVSDMDALCIWQVQVSVYCACRIPAHLRFAQCCVLLHLIDVCFRVCIFLVQTNPDLCVCRTWISLDISRFSQKREMSRLGQPHSGIVWLLCPKTVNLASIAGGRRGEFRLCGGCSVPPRVCGILRNRPEGFMLFVPRNVNHHSIMFL